jgi:hypothetical protein
VARIRWDGTELVVELTRREKVAALHRDVRVPRGAVRRAALLDDGLAAVRGLRAPGLHVPGRAKIGTWRGPGGRVFAVVRRQERAVRIELATGQRYRELVVGGPDAAAAAAALR